MLTPVDIQQKKFHVGLGYDKKDVNTFFEEVCKSYEELYRSNADLKDRVITLTDGLQNYKSKEAALEKSLMLAEKDAEDTKSSATKEAKTIRSEAKAQAQSILQDAEKRLEQLKAEITLLETQYAAYKSNFCNLMKRQFEFMKEEDFDVDAYIDEVALGVLVSAGGGVATSSAGAGNASFSYSGDPQMRDESTLGGMSSGGGIGSHDELNSTSAVYTSNLGANENFVDPFNPTNKGNGRYNPYDSLNPKKDKKNNDDNDGEKKTTFTVNSGKNRARRGPIPTQNQTSSFDSNYSKNETKNEPKVEPKAEVKAEPKVEEVKEESVNYSSDEKPKSENLFSTTNMTDNNDSKSTFNLDDDVAEIIADVEEKINGRALIGEEESNEDTDEFGFEFI